MYDRNTMQIDIVNQMLLSSLIPICFCLCIIMEVYIIRSIRIAFIGKFFVKMVF